MSRGNPAAARTADALVELARNYADVQAVEHPAPLFVVQVPLEGPAELCGIPLPEGMVEKLRASAKVQPVLVDEQGTEVDERQARHPRCRRGCATACCAATVTADSAATAATGCRCTTSGRRAGVAATTSPTSRPSASVAVPTTMKASCLTAPCSCWEIRTVPTACVSCIATTSPQLAQIAGVESVYDLNGHPVITDPEQLDAALARIRAGPVTAAA